MYYSSYVIVRKHGNAIGRCPYMVVIVLVIAGSQC